MASSSSSSVSPSAQTAHDPKTDLRRKIQGHEFAITELNNLSSSRAVYQRNGAIFFRTSVKAAIASEQRQLDLAKSQLQKPSSA